MKLIRKALADLRPHPRNPRRISKADLASLTASVREFDLVEPLVWNKRTNYVLGGHQRLAVLRQAKETHTDVVPVDLDENRELALMAALNKPAGEFTPDIDALVRETEAALPDLSKMLGLDSLLNGGRGPKPEVIEDEAPEPPKKPISKTGDLWILGDHRIMCADSTKAEDVARLMATDPPYLVDYRGGNHPQSWSNKPDVKDKHWDDYHDPKMAVEFYDAFLRTAIERACGPRFAVYQWHADMRRGIVIEAWARNEILTHQVIVWTKTRPVLGRSHFMWQHEPCLYGWPKGMQPERKPPSNATTIWQIDQKGESDGIHPTQKPIALFARPIDWHTNPGEIVYEPFSGSGTQIIAAEQLGRRCYAMEIAPAYVDVAVLRWQRLSGKQAVHAESGKPFGG